MPIRAEPLRRWNLRPHATSWISIAAGAAGPIGGDQLHLDVDVGPGATLVLRSVAATLVLPGPHGEPSQSDVTIRVAAGATLLWLPGPVIAARHCDHHATTQVTLEPGARLLIREELVLGRHDEQPGSLHQRLRVRLDDRPLLDQELRVGPGAPGWDGPAVTGGRRAVGSLLVVDPEWETAGRFSHAAVAAEADTARLPLPGPAVLFTALAPDLLTLRQRLATGLRDLDDESLAGALETSSARVRTG